MTVVTNNAKGEAVDDAKPDAKDAKKDGAK